MGGLLFAGSLFGGRTVVTPVAQSVRSNYAGGSAGSGTRRKVVRKKDDDEDVFMLLLL
jgi:hypothetical protein